MSTKSSNKIVFRNQLNVKSNKLYLFQQPSENTLNQVKLMATNNSVIVYVSKHLNNYNLSLLENITIRRMEQISYEFTSILSMEEINIIKDQSATNDVCVTFKTLKLKSKSKSEILKKFNNPFNIEFCFKKLDKGKLIEQFNIQLKDEIKELDKKKSLKRKITFAGDK